MKNWPLLLIFLFAAITLTTALGDVVKIPASSAIYIDLDSLHVHNNTSILKCVYQTEENSSPTYISLLQFNISGLKFSDSDIGILVLKPAKVFKQSNATNLVVLLPIGSNWSGSSNAAVIIDNIMLLSRLIEKKDISQMVISTADGQVFDVSKILKETKGDRVSFLLMAFSDRDYSVQLKSLRSDEGPCLLVMPYPSKETMKNSQQEDHGMIIAAR
jgi:hypothetical protein